MRIPLASLLVSAFAISCLGQSPQAPADSLPSLQHIDVANVDSSIGPCVNFHQYVCARVFAANPIPPDQIAWGSGSILQEWNRAVLRRILEKNEAPSSSRTPAEQKIGDFYATCTTQASSKVNDLPAIRPLLARIRDMRDKHEIPVVLAAIHSSFGRAWEGSENQTNVALFGFGPQPDYNDVSQVVAGVDQGGLGMPSRDFYLSDDAQMKAQRDKYQTLLNTFFKMEGSSNPAAAATVLRLETVMARAQMDNITRRDPNKTNNRYTPAQLHELTPAFDWDSYFHALGAPSVPLYEVSAPDFFHAIDNLLINEDLATWKIYLRAHLLLSAAASLGNEWRDAYFDYSRALTGQQQQPPDWRRCTSATDAYLGEALGRVYVDQVFPPDSKARAKKMVHDIEAAMSRDIDAVTWMQPATKHEAQLKLAAVMDKIGYPDKWIDYSSLTITRSSYP